MPGWLKAGWGRRRQWRLTRREFVYLDEVSVTSLMAAKHGSIPDTITDSLSRTSESEMNASLNAPGKTGTFGSRMKASETSGRQVVRRTVIQGTFRDLRTGDSDLILTAEPKPVRRRSKRAQLASPQDLKSIQRLVSERRAICIDDLHRGDVIELEVRLEAEKIYQLMTALSSIVNMAKDHESFFGIGSIEFKELKPLLDLFESMLVGLVPITGTASRYRLLDAGSRTYIIDTDALEPDSEAFLEARPFTIVGVTEQPSYWKDLRRILFDEDIYTVYARLTKSGLTSDWNPIKLGDVLESVAPGTRSEFRRILTSLDTEGSPTPTPTPDKASLPQQVVVDALITFGRKLAKDTGQSVADDSLRAAAEIASLKLTSAADLGDVLKLRQTFEAIVDVLYSPQPAGPPPTSTPSAPSEAEEAPDPVDADESMRELVRTTRDQAILSIKNELAKPQQPVEFNPSVVSPVVTEQLEVEFIAIYW